MIPIKILILTGQQSYQIILNITKPLIKHQISVEKVPISISAFLTEKMTREILEKKNLSEFELVLIPGFVQWDTTKLEKDLKIPIKKGPEFASELPVALKSLTELQLSNVVPANKLLKTTGKNIYLKFVKERYEQAKDQIGTHTFYLNKKKSDLMIGRDLPPPIIAEIVNCTEKSDHDILRKLSHYINSGADIIDIGCVANKPNPKRVNEIINLIHSESNILISIDSMDSSEIFAALDNDIDLILSLDLGTYEEFLGIDRTIPIVILPTILKKGYFPKDPKTRINNLFKLTNILQENGFKKLIADPLLETPITPGICNSLEAYFLYKKEILKPKNRNLELPMFFGISNVVELMDIDSVGINGLLASIAIELDMGILFTVEHSTKMMDGVEELKRCTKLNYLAKQKSTPPINQGIQIFKAKGKVSQPIPELNFEDAIYIKNVDKAYVPDENGYFKIHVNHYNNEIYVLFYTTAHNLIQTFIGNNAEALSKKIISQGLTKNLDHLNYLGRELNKAEFCLKTGKPYIQDE